MRQPFRALCVRWLSLSAIPAAAALAILPAHITLAQATKVEPYYVVVTQDTPMRADAGNVYYGVRRLKPGDVLRIDGENKGWLRAEYLPGIMAFIPVAEAELSADQSSLKLKTSSQLLAVDMNGVRPWWPLLEAPLAAGTSFSGVEVVKAADGALEGYRVPAPAKARGWVAQGSIRRATAAEAQGYTGATPPPAAPAATPVPTSSMVSPTKGGPATAPAAPSVAQPAGPGETTTTKTTSPDGTTTTTTTTTEPVPPGFEMVNNTGRTTLKQTTSSTSQTTTTPAAPGAASAPTEPKDAAGVPLTKRITDVAQLRSLYDRGMRAGAMNELNEIIGEFDKSLASLATADPHLLTELTKRLDALRLKRDVMSARESSQALTRTIDERTRSLSLALAEVNKQAVYTIVGTMLPSTVYDGSRGMPLLYRIDSPDVFSTRTVGYVVARDGIDLSGKTGRVVGVIGDSKMDPALSVTIVDPTRIDVLNFVEGKYVIESSQTIQQQNTTTTTEFRTAPAVPESAPAHQQAPPPPATEPAPQ